MRWERSRGTCFGPRWKNRFFHPNLLRVAAIMEHMAASLQNTICQRECEYKQQRTRDSHKLTLSRCETRLPLLSISHLVANTDGSQDFRCDQLRSVLQNENAVTLVVRVQCRKRITMPACGSQPRLVRVQCHRTQLLLTRSLKGRRNMFPWWRSSQKC